MGHALTIRSVDDLRPHWRSLMLADQRFQWREEGDGTWVCSLNQASARFRPLLAVGLSAHQVESLAQVTAGQGTPALVVVPSLSGSTYEACRARGLSCLDLNGRMFLHAPGFLVERALPSGRHFRTGLPARRLFSGRACRLARVLLSQKGAMWTIRDLARDARLSLGTVQSLLVAYHRDGLVAGVRGDWRVTSTDKLVEAWRSADRWNRRVTETWFGADLSDWRHVCRQVVLRLGRDAGVAFTQFAGAGLRRTDPALPRVTFYTTAAVTDLAEVLGWDPGRKDSEILVLTPEDPAIGDQGINVEGLPVCCDGQIYVDLVAAGAGHGIDAEAFKSWGGFLQPQGSSKGLPKRSDP
jgi:hypothetical protein